MMKASNWDIGVASWSLERADFELLIRVLTDVKLSHTQLALYNLLSANEATIEATRRQFADAGITFTATMIGFEGEDYSTIQSIRKTGGLVPDDQWNARLARCERCADITKQLGVGALSCHVGFLPISSDPRYPIMLDRVATVAQKFADLGLDFMLETGQETANTLLQFLNDLPTKNVKANFDPANMILYGAGHPVDAIHTLSRHIGHVHIKDATLSSQPGVNWGKEVPFGQGHVEVVPFLKALRDVGYNGPLVIEREHGPTRVADVKFAVETLLRAGKTVDEEK